ncbi:MAG TPA: hypothetical protein VIJ57_03435 [Hanamia sp.]
MKKVFLFVTAALLFAATSNAQVQRNSSSSQRVQSDSARHGRNGKMMNELNLSQDQKTQIKSLHQENKQQRDAIKNDASLTPDQKKQKMKELHQSQSDKMNSILTPDQQAKRKQMIAERKQNRQTNGNKMHRNAKANTTIQ